MNLVKSNSLHKLRAARNILTARSAISSRAISTAPPQVNQPSAQSSLCRLLFPNFATVRHMSRSRCDGNCFIKIGHVGDESGQRWDEKGNTDLAQIFISHGEGINSIQFQYVENGELVLSDRHGNINGGPNFDVVKLNYPEEYITWIRCHRNVFDGALNSITFGTNRGVYGPFGEQPPNVKEFSFQLGQDRQFGGFYGTVYNNIVYSIGVYLKPIETLGSSVNDNVVKKEY